MTLQIDPVFSMVSATVSPVLMSTASQYFWSDFFNVLQSSCMVHCQPSVYGVLLTGTLSQVTKAGEVLELKWRQHCQDPKLRHIDQSGTNFVQGDTSLYQHGTSISQTSTYVNQSDTNFNQGRMNFNHPSTTCNQMGAPFSHVGMHINHGSTHFDQSGMNFTEHIPARNQQQQPNSMGSSFGRHEFASSGYAFPGSPGSQVYQQNVHPSLQQGYQQPGGNWEGQCPNDRDRRELGNLGCNQPYLDRDVRYVNQPSDAKQSGFVVTNVNPQSFGNQPNTHPEYTARSPTSGERDRLSTKSPNLVDSTRNPLPFGNPPNTHPEHSVRSPGAGETNLRSSEPPISVDRTKSPQPIHNSSKRPPPGIMDESLNSTTIEVGQANGSRRDPSSPEPDTSTDSTRNPQPLENGRNQTNMDSTTGEGSKTPEVDDIAVPSTTRITAMPESSLSITTSFQSSVNDQQSTNPSTEPERSIMSNDKTDYTNERSPVVPSSTTNHQSPDDHQQSPMLNTTNGAGTLTTSSIPPGSPLNKQPDSRGEKPPSLHESSTHTEPADSDHQASMIEPNTEPQNSSNQTGAPSDEKSNCLTGNQPHSPDHSIELHPPHNDQPQQGITTNTTTESQNSTTSDKQTTVPSADAARSPLEKPYNAVEKIPNDIPHHNQQQTTPKQQTSAPENTNTETSFDNSPVLKLAEEPSLEQTPNSTSKPQKRTPIPRPRQNKLGSGEKRQNAANFSSPVKATQARQGSPSPTESSNNCTDDKPTTTTNPNEENDQIATTQNSKTSITTNEDDLD